MKNISREDYEKLWKILICNYGGTHDEQKELIFHYLKDYETAKVVTAIEEAIREYRFFPNVNEILSCIPEIKNESDELVPEWFSNPERCVSLKPSEEEQRELDELLKEFKGV